MNETRTLRGIIQVTCGLLCVVVAYLMGTVGAVFPMWVFGLTGVVFIGVALVLAISF